MPLISNLTSGLSTALTPGNSATAPGQQQQAADAEAAALAAAEAAAAEAAAQAEAEAAAAEEAAAPVVEEAPRTPGSNGLYTYYSFKTDTPAASSSATSAVEAPVATEEQKVQAIDFARRAAIAAQAKASTQSLIEGMAAGDAEDTGFEPLAKTETSGRAAYANVNAAPAKSGTTYRNDV